MKLTDLHRVFEAKADPGELSFVLELIGREVGVSPEEASPDRVLRAVMGMRHQLAVCKGQVASNDGVAFAERGW